MPSLILPFTDMSPMIERQEERVEKIHAEVNKLAAQARQEVQEAGRNAERADQLKKSLEIKDAQLRATLDAPRNRGELVDRLRDGEF